MLKVWSKRHHDLSRARNQLTCRSRRCSATWSPGGFSKEISVGHATRVAEQVRLAGAIAQARHELAGQFLEDLRNLDTQLRETRKQLTAAVKASHTTLTVVFGVGPVIAGTIIGDAGDISRFASGDHFAAYNGTAPVEVSSGNKKAGYRCAATGASTTPSTWPRSPRDATGTATVAPTTTARSLRARPIRKHSGPSNGGSAVSPRSCGSERPSAVAAILESLRSCRSLFRAAQSTADLYDERDRGQLADNAEGDQAAG